MAHLLSHTVKPDPLLPRGTCPERSPAIQQKAAGLNVRSGDKMHAVGAEITKLDTMRTNLLANITTSLNNQQFNLSSQLQTLDKFDRYCTKLADVVTANDPTATDVSNWLQTNAAIAGAWREALLSTESLQENSRLAELDAIETRRGDQFSGSLADDISRLRGIADSPQRTATLAQDARRVSRLWTQVRA